MGGIMRTTNVNEMATRPAAQLHHLFLSELARMKDAESQLTTAIPLLVKVARSEDLKTLLQIHLKETEGHVKTIQEIAETLREELPDRSCRGMTALIHESVMSVVKEAGELVSAKKDFSFLDAALIAAAQRIEHYEMAAYRSLCSWAKRMGHRHALALLTSNLEQEKNADILLTGVAEGSRPLAELIQQMSLRKVTKSQR
jgi:ferritin-like metal-binding protein YciE